LRHLPSPIWRAVRLHQLAAMASSQRSKVPSFPVAWKVGVLPWRAGPRNGPPARHSPLSSARRKRGRLRRHHRGPTAGMTDKKGDPFRCPTLASTSRRDEGIEESYRLSTSALTTILPVPAQFSQTLAPFQQRHPACCERQLPRPTASDKILRNRAVACDFFAAGDRCRLLHGVAQGCPGRWTAATIPFTCRSRAAIGS
jgi:hypothetical protein